LLIGAGEFSMSMSDHQQGKERLTEARRLAATAGAPRIEGWALAYLMTNELWRLDFDAARAYGEQGLQVFKGAEDRLGIGYVTFMMAGVDFSALQRSGGLTSDFVEDVMSRLEPMVAGAQQYGERNLVGHLFDLLGAIAIEVERLGEAGEHLSEAVDAFDTLGNQICLAHTLDRVALLGAAANQPAASVTLLAATDALRQRLGVSARLIEQDVFDEALAISRKSLASDEFENTWADGAGMNSDQAVQQARTIIRTTTS
jgi:hypothetical protein